MAGTIGRSPSLADQLEESVAGIDPVDAWGADGAEDADPEQRRQTDHRELKITPVPGPKLLSQLLYSLTSGVDRSQQRQVYDPGVLDGEVPAEKRIRPNPHPNEITGRKHELARSGARASRPREVSLSSRLRRGPNEARQEGEEHDDGKCRLYARMCSRSLLPFRWPRDGVRAVPPVQRRPGFRLSGALRGSIGRSGNDSETPLTFEHPVSHADRLVDVSISALPDGASFRAGGSMAIAPTLRLAGLGGATVLALAFLSSASPAPQVAEVTIREGTNMAAAISPDGETLAIDALGRIWVLPAEGGTASALTDPVGDARQPVWAPDGGRIAFQAYWDGNYHIWAVSSDGASLEQLTDGPFDHREPHWSADGSRIAFSSDRAGTYDIWELLLTTGVVQRMTDGPDNEYGPAYAPDGSGIAYAADGAGSGIWVQGRDGRGIRAVAVAGQVNAPSWSPDGETLAYVKTTRSESTLMVATLGESGEGIPVTDAGEDVFPFRASWGGDGVVYTGDGKIRTRVGPRRTARDLPFEATVTLDRPAYTRRVRDLDAPGPHPVRGIISPAVSPDGESVAFSALGDLWVVPVGARPVRVTDDPWIEIDPAWSPDGSRLAYASDRAGQVDLWVRDVASGEERRITDGGGTLPTWSPDGSRIAFIGGGRSADRVQIVDVETGDARIVRTGLNRAGRPTWSPDGSHLGISAHQRYSTRFRRGGQQGAADPYRASDG